MMNDQYWMQKAYEQAILAQSEGEIPVGAVLVSKDKRVIKHQQKCEFKTAMILRIMQK